MLKAGIFSHHTVTRLTVAAMEPLEVAAMEPHEHAGPVQMSRKVLLTGRHMEPDGTGPTGPRPILSQSFFG